MHPKQEQLIQIFIIVICDLTECYDCEILECFVGSLCKTGYDGQIILVICIQYTNWHDGLFWMHIMLFKSCESIWIHCRTLHLWYCVCHQSMLVSNCWGQYPLACNQLQQCVIGPVLFTDVWVVISTRFTYGWHHSGEGLQLFAKYPNQNDVAQKLVMKPYGIINITCFINPCCFWVQW